VLTLELPVRRIFAHPSVRACQNKVAIQRGPIVYCAEQADHSDPVRHLCLPEDAALQASFEADLLGGVVTITGTARAALPGEALYGPAPQTKPCPIRLIPYYVWNNRQPGEMRVWLPVAP